MGWLFFLHIAILFHQCNDENIICQQFYCCLHCIFYTYTVYIVMFWCIFPFSSKLEFFCKKSIFFHSFWPRWLKQTSFYMELNALDLSRCIIFVFHVSSKKIKNIKKYARKCKILKKKKKKNLNYIFQKFKKHCLWCSSPRLCKWNKVLNFVLFVKL